MFPHAHDAPACPPQSPRNLQVTLPVAAELGKPVGPVTCRVASMLRAAMPEAAIHEHRKTLLGKDEIRLAGNRLITAPADDSTRAEDGG
jgi:hypothetical protein